MNQNDGLNNWQYMTSASAMTSGSSLLLMPYERQLFQSCYQHNVWRCDYCGAWLPNDKYKCPNCGANRSNL